MKLSSFFACLAPQKPYNLDINFRLKKKIIVGSVKKHPSSKKSNLTANIVTLVNVESNLDFLFGNQKHLKLSARTYGFSHAF